MCLRSQKEFGRTVAVPSDMFYFFQFETVKMATVLVRVKRKPVVGEKHSMTALLTSQTQTQSQLLCCHGRWSTRKMEFTRLIFQKLALFPKRDYLAWTACRHQRLFTRWRPNYNSITIRCIFRWRYFLIKSKSFNVVIWRVNCVFDVSLKICTPSWLMCDDRKINQNAELEEIWRWTLPLVY